ncbi:MAG: DUF4982 domain-containing protein [Butyrivibrio sp.]|nr:DUF4982 domain-containing protein [Butyrivibrio sp.]
MKKISFNDNWICFVTGNRDSAIDVTLPHDALLLDEKDDNSVTGVNLGWFVPKDYSYEKVLFAEKDWEDTVTVLYFEGIYHKATVYINGQKAAYQDYGYTGFYVDVTELLKYGENNTVLVEAVNTDQPNSRWYSGTGIYRPVWIYQMPKKHILINGIKVDTISLNPPTIKVNVKTNGEGKVTCSIDELGRSEETSADSEGNASIIMELQGAELWSPDSPKLYDLKVCFGEDVREERIGIRILKFNDKTGFSINRNRVILRGACIHHDNGILGAAGYEFSDYRKIRLMKENGYNAVRSAHNPCSEATLRACDEMGVLMMDEYVDAWYIHKTKNDYATKVESNYKTDLKALVDKDYNHPSVIMYSTGNEVAETAQEKGIELCGNMTDYLHSLDPSRPVSCGINIFFNFLSTMGFGVYSDKKAEQEVKNVKKKKAVGSEFFNNLAGILGADFMKFGATLYPCDVLTRGAFARMDFAGYNYGINRYVHDLKKYKSRLILGSETFCSDAYRFIELAKKEPRIIGDFVWSGMDYLGEVGVGSWEYEEYAPDFSHGKGWVAAGSGRVDLTGKPLSEADYTRVAFEQLDIAIGVIPVKFASQKHSPSAWKMTNAMASWSFDGCENMNTKVEVYARAYEIELFLNNKSLGKKKPQNDCKVVFDVIYNPGELKAVAYDNNGKTIAETSLFTAKKETVLVAEPEQKAIEMENGLAYIRLKFTDTDGVLKPLERDNIKVEVTGGELIGLGSACPYYPLSYLGDVCDTYYGEALAVVRPSQKGEIVVKATAMNMNLMADAMVEVR